MKKILSLLVLLVTFASCEEDVKFNNPAVQGLKDDELWRAAQYTATRETDNSLTIVATNGFEILTLRTASVDPGVYDLGVNEQNKATFSVSVDGIEQNYQTGTDLGDGKIEITVEDTDMAQGFITGTFRFNAVEDDGTVLNFRNGVFYRVPIQPVGQ
ncbi:hypothetical protein FUA48_05720 [Flavobacterium alkalisoli]|uniref:Uncharacterized protein n=1 Tax=Flavobacterium alkalisoli TaxID=2602769 RepID=A0A5B9FQI8_9FLAO|nr:DUF6252 family protein [Flavobacterium alkalisoli]QEE49095.1 hypothetical protein FUA48_05720 [Flavobacterium alkalisoli]